MEKKLTTPILFLIFNRPDTTQKVLNAIRQAKPKQLFVAADGPRENKKGEREKCEQTRRIIEQVDWDCEVHTLFRDKNLGCKMAVSSVEIREEIKREMKDVPWARFLVNNLGAQDIIKNWLRHGKQLSISNAKSPQPQSSRLLKIPDRPQIKLHTSNARFSNSKMKKLLGWEQKISFNEAIELTKKWLEHQRLP